MTHQFILTPGIWEGKGTITFSMADDVLPFHVRWEIGSAQEKGISCLQVISIEGIEEKRMNLYRFNFISPHQFTVYLEGTYVGQAEGRGLMDSSMLAWEFHDASQEVEGIEVYLLQPDGSYTLKAEYSAESSVRTFIKGSIKQVS